MAGRQLSDPEQIADVTRQRKYSLTVKWASQGQEGRSWSIQISETSAEHTGSLVDSGELAQRKI